MKNNYVIGVAGGSGSGKTTFASRMKNCFEEKLTVINCDNYYLPQDHLNIDERAKTNYDSPNAIDFKLIVEQIQRLKTGRRIECPVYDYTRHTRSDRVIEIDASPIILVDGILVLANEDLRNLLDLKIFVDLDADERILRRIRRDMQERGRSYDSIVNQYLSTVKPMHNLYVEPSKTFADFIINGVGNEVAFDVVRTKVLSMLRG